MAAKSILNLLFGKSKAKSKDSGERKHPRLRVFNLIKFTLSDGTHYETISNIVNLSETGLQFTLYEELPPGQTLKMLISVPHANKEIPIKAKLVWCRKDKNRRGVFVAGVKFDAISDEHQGLLREMVQAGRHSRGR